MKRILLPLLISTLFGCQAIRDVDYVSDEVYFQENVMHRFNASTMLNNPNVAMPDSSYSYYDEEYANSLRPNYSDRIRRLESGSANTSYDDASRQELTETDYNNSAFGRNTWANSPAWGLGVGVGTGVVVGAGAGNPYFSPYYSPYSRGGSSVYRGSSVRTSEQASYNPNVSNSRIQGASKARADSYFKSVTRGSNNPSRSYRSKSQSQPTGVYSNPGYYSPSNSRGSYSPGGTVRGAYRR
jgi:hypothetical protein